MDPTNQMRMPWGLGASDPGRCGQGGHIAKGGGGARQMLPDTGILLLYMHILLRHAQGLASMRWHGDRWTWLPSTEGMASGTKGKVCCV